MEAEALGMISGVLHAARLEERGGVHWVKVRVGRQTPKFAEKYFQGISWVIPAEPSSTLAASTPHSAELSPQLWLHRVNCWPTPKPRLVDSRLCFGVASPGDVHTSAAKFGKHLANLGQASMKPSRSRTNRCSGEKFSMYVRGIRPETGTAMSMF